MELRLVTEGNVALTGSRLHKNKNRAEELSWHTSNALNSKTLVFPYDTASGFL